ncbi:MAG: serine protease [Pseudomonadota bacterium]
MGHFPGANAAVAWLQAHDRSDEVAGNAFLLSRNLACTCAHVVRDHLGIKEHPSKDIPDSPIKLRFEALSTDAVAYVAGSGWWPEDCGGEINDLAILKLDSPIDETEFAGLAVSAPRPQENCYIYGVESGYQSIGQTVFAQLAANPGARGWRQLNARPGQERGYFIRKGFSGSPVFDDLGNTIWGMVVAVETEADKYVGYALTAEDLRKATKTVVSSTGEEASKLSYPSDRVSDFLDNLGRDALAALLPEIERRLRPDSSLP